MEQTDLQIIAICVCTYKRPRLLEECLASLAKLNIPVGFSPTIVVVDNDPDRTAEAVVAFQRGSEIPVGYIVEGRRGIPFARNCALKASQTLKARWIAFIDDDERADPDWLMGLMHDDHLDTPILMGWQISEPPELKPFWFLEGPRREPKEGEVCTTAFTHNVRFAAAILDSGLAFDEQLALTGGEDAKFFFAAHAMGFAIRRTNRAITYETMHEARLGYLRQCYRSYWIASANYRKDVAKFGPCVTMLKRTHTVPIQLLGGAALLIASPIALLLGLRPFKKLALSGGQKMGLGVGRLAAMFGHLPRPYAIVDGH